jgi:hypothetical protein
MPEKMRFMSTVRVGGGASRRVFIEEQGERVKRLRVFRKKKGLSAEDAEVSPRSQGRKTTAEMMRR